MTGLMQANLIKDYNRAMKSQNTNFMNVIANRLVDNGLFFHAENLINEIHYLSEDITKKSEESIVNRFRNIIENLFQ